MSLAFHFDTSIQKTMTSLGPRYLGTDPHIIPSQRQPYQLALSPTPNKPTSPPRRPVWQDSSPYCMLVRQMQIPPSKDRFRNLRPAPAPTGFQPCAPGKVESWMSSCGMTRSSRLSWKCLRRLFNCPVYVGGWRSTPIFLEIRRSLT